MKIKTGAEIKYRAAKLRYAKKKNERIQAAHPGKKLIEKRWSALLKSNNVNTSRMRRSTLNVVGVAQTTGSDSNQRVMLVGTARR